MLRFTSSSLLRSRLSIPLLAISNPNNLRFFSPNPKRLLQIRSSKRRDKEEAVVEKGEEGGNGGLLGKEKGARAGDGRIVPAELHKEATEAYAMSVLLGRALPDVRDGLKPVHRWILYAMHELGLSSQKPFKKCARVVGEDFSMRFPLIRGHGNFGSIDADPPAAMRYTECRLEENRTKKLLPHLFLWIDPFSPSYTVPLRSD